MLLGLIKKNLIFAALLAFLIIPLLAAHPARAEIISWNGYDWSLTGADASVDSNGYLNLSADGTFHSYSGKITGAAGLYEDEYFTPGSVDMFTASWVDSGALNQATWAVVKMEYADGTAGFAMLGNSLNASNYIATWGFREAITGDAPWTAIWSLVLGARTEGAHTTKFVRNDDGSTQLWFDGIMVTEQSEVLLSAFQVMNLVNQNQSGGDSVSIFTDARASADAATPEPSSLFLLGSAMAGFAAWRGRRMKKSVGKRSPV